MQFVRVVSALALAVLLSTGALAKSGGNSEFPGVGSEKDWREACTINTKATEAMQASENKKAVALLKQAIAKYPYETGFYGNLGQCYKDLGDNKSAEDAYRKAVALCEKYGVKYADSYLELARLCQKRAAMKEAEKHYQKATQLYGTLETWRAYAEFLESQKRATEAAAARKKVSELEEKQKQFLKQ